MRPLCVPPLCPSARVPACGSVRARARSTMSPLRDLALQLAFKVTAAPAVPSRAVWSQHRGEPRPRTAACPGRPGRACRSTCSRRGPRKHRPSLIHDRSSGRAPVHPKRTDLGRPTPSSSPARCRCVTARTSTGSSASTARRMPCLGSAIGPAQQGDLVTRLILLGHRWSWTRPRARPPAPRAGSVQGRAVAAHRKSPPRTRHVLTIADRSQELR